MLVLQFLIHVTFQSYAKKSVQDTPTRKTYDFNDPHQSYPDLQVIVTKQNQYTIDIKVLPLNS